LVFVHGIDVQSEMILGANLPFRPLPLLSRLPLVHKLVFALDTRTIDYGCTH